MEFFELKESIFGSVLRRELLKDDYCVFVRLHYKEGFIDYTIQPGSREPFHTPNAFPGTSYIFYRLDGNFAWHIEWCFNTNIFTNHRNEYNQTAHEVWNNSLRRYTNPTPITIEQNKL